MKIKGYINSYKHAVIDCTVKWTEWSCILGTGGTRLWKWTETYHIVHTKKKKTHDVNIAMCLNTTDFLSIFLSDLHHTVRDLRSFDQNLLYAPHSRSNKCPLSQLNSLGPNTYSTFYKLALHCCWFLSLFPFVSCPQVLLVNILEIVILINSDFHFSFGLDSFLCNNAL